MKRFQLRARERGVRDGARVRGNGLLDPETGAAGLDDEMRCLKKELWKSSDRGASREARRFIQTAYPIELVREFLGAAVARRQLRPDPEDHAPADQ
jgi:hypothetical protein